jgi:hypothetical protein
MKKKRPGPASDQEKKTPRRSVLQLLRINFSEWNLSFSRKSGKDRILFGFKTALFLLWLLGSLGLIGYWLIVPRTRRYNYDFTRKETIQVCTEFKGWVATEKGLALEPGKEAKLRFLLLLGPRETFSVRPWCYSDPPSLTNQMVFHYWSAPGSAANVTSNGDKMIDPAVPPDFHGHCTVDFSARRTPGEPNNPVIVLKRLDLEVKSRRTLSFPGFLAFLFFTLFLYFVFAFYAIPESVVPLIGDLSSPSRIRKIFALAFILIVGWTAWRFFIKDTRWFESKTFDDKMAISNASALLDNNFHIDSLYFRSSQRPIFVAFSLPIVTLSPNRLDSVTRSPSDFREKIWMVYKQPFRDQQSAFLPVSLASLALGILMLVLFYQILLMMGCREIQALLAIPFFAYFYRNVAAVHVTQTFNLFINILAMFVYLKIHQRRSLFGWIAAGITLSLAGLTKNTAQSTAAAVFIHQLLFVLLRPRGKRDIPLLIVYWISVLVPVLVWYQGFLNGLFFELKKLHQDAFVRTRELMHYTPTSPQLIKACFIVLLRKYKYLSLAGMALSLISPKTRKTSFVFIVWALAVTPMFLLPFVFPRFFKYFIPAAAYFSSAFVVGIISFMLFIIRRFFPGVNV